MSLKATYRRIAGIAGDSGLGADQSGLLGPGTNLAVWCDASFSRAGGHAAAEVCRSALSALVASLHGLAGQYATSSHTGLPDDLMRGIVSAIRAASDALHEKVLADPDLFGARATLAVMVCLDNRKAVLAHVGDARGYVLRDGKLQALTKDRQTALGLWGACHVETLVLDTEPTDTFLLAGGGLADRLVAGGALVDSLRATSLDEAADKTLKLAQDKGGAAGQHFVVLRHDEGAKPGPYSRLAAVTRFRALGACPFFAELSFLEMLRVSSLGQTLTCQSGEVVIQQGDVDETFFVVLDGAVAVQTQRGENILRGVGEHFGEMGLLGRVPRSATVVAQGDPTRLWRLDARALSIAITQDPILGNRLYRKFLMTLGDIIRNDNEERR